ncbi:MAG: threonine-phosphate decarboxylase CobD [Lachnospiraceae bacterium]|nr:threonine-phosphate decarboxylase CobD [Lachnospiraceae bacterium]
MNNGHGGDIYAYTHLPGTDITDFSANINPFPMPQEIADAVAAGISGLAAYPDCYCRELRKRLARAVGCTEEDILCGNGAAELIYSIVYARRPKKALLLSPCFTEYEAALRAAGAQLVYHELSADNGFALTDDFEARLNGDLDIVFLCVPNNPTGMVIEKARLEKIADICGKNDILLVLDECFNDFLDKPEEYSMLDRIAGRRRLVIIRSFTKMFALAGLRLGYAVSADHELFEKIYSQRQPWAVSTLAQRAGIAALGQSAFAKSSREYLQRERAYLERELRLLGARVFEGKANFILFYLEDSCCDFNEELAKKGFLIRDCGNFRGLKTGYRRIAVRKHEDNVRLVEAIRLVQGGEAAYESL